MSTTTTRAGRGSGPGAGWLGSLADTPLAEVFRRIVFEELSGDLQVTIPSATKTVYFDRGFVVFASSDRKSDRLGESMIEAGRISRHEFALASTLMADGKRRFGRALVQAGILPEEELGRHVAAQVNRIVLSLFSESRGVYSFDERACTIPIELMVSLSAHRILLEGIRRMSKGRLILAGLPALDTPLQPVERPPFTLDVDKLRPVEKAVLRAAREAMPIRRIVSMVQAKQGQVLRACYGLYASGVMEAVSVRERKRPRRVQEETGTFVLSEILRKLEPVEEHERGAASPEDEASQEADLHAETTRRPSREAAARSDEAAEEQDRGQWVAFTSSLAELGSEVGKSLASAGRKSARFLKGLASPPPRWLTSWKELVRRAGRTIAKSTETLRRRLEVKRSPEGGGPAVDAPEARTRPDEHGEEPWLEPDEATEPEVGVPSWSMRDDPRDPETASGPDSLGVPSWSMKDDPGVVAEPMEDIVEDKPPATDQLEVPSWSILHDGSAEAEEATSTQEGGEVLEPEAPLEVRGERSEPLQAKPEAGPARSRDEPANEALVAEDEEFFVELASEPGALDEPSMLSPIPIEPIADEIAIDDEPEFVFEVDPEAFEGREEPEKPVVMRPPDDDTADRLSGKRKEQRHASEQAPADLVAPETEDARPAAPERAAARETPSAAGETEVPPPAKPKRPREDRSERDVVVTPSEQQMRAQRASQGGGEARLFRDVKLHFKVRDWEGAIRLLEELIELSPANFLYRGMLARAMAHHPHLRHQAEKHFVEAMRMSPQNPDLHYWLGLYYKSFGLKSRAYNEFRTALRIAPEHAGARRHLAMVGKREDALGSVFKKLFG